MANFDYAFVQLMKAEGPYNDVANDVPTAWGVTLESFQNWKNNVKLTKEDLKLLTESDAKRFYFEKYWTPLLLDKVADDHLTSIILNQCVNAGIVAGMSRLQKSLVKEGFMLQIDGKMGQNTLLALSKMDGKKIARRFIFDSQLFYADVVIKNPSKIVFLKGWLNRTHELLEQIA